MSKRNHNGDIKCKRSPKVDDVYEFEDIISGDIVPHIKPILKDLKLAKDLICCTVAVGHKYEDWESLAGLHSRKMVGGWN